MTNIHEYNRWADDAIMSLATALEKHDWYYQMSDDLRVFEKGLENETKLTKALASYTYEQLEPYLSDHVKKEVKRLYALRK